MRPSVPSHEAFLPSLRAPIERSNASKRRALKSCISEDHCVKMLTKSAALFAIVATSAFAACPNSCSGHGKCDGNDKCTCYNRKDGIVDAEGRTVPAWVAPDCSERTCPYSAAWIDDPSADNTAHRMAECSNAGTCDRASGECQCYAGYTGRACDRTSCPSDCSGHGTCQSLKQFYVDHQEEADSREGGGVTLAYSTAWDATKMFGCKCELGYRGPDCAQRECPSGADPQGGPDGDGFVYSGTGHVEYRDCSGRGTCDYTTGLCNCFRGAYGEDCALQSALV